MIKKNWKDIVQIHIWTKYNSSAKLKRNNKQSYKNYLLFMILSVLDKAAGFFSVFFFTLNHYLNSIRTSQSFKIESSKWLYKYEKGWEDYFLNVDIINPEDTEPITVMTHNKINNNYFWGEYRHVIQDVYKYNRETQLQINLAYSILKLEKDNYGAIYIRRGDKLCSESNLFETEKYVQVLLNKYPDCNAIFVQSDDYNVVLEVKKYIQDNNLNIRVLDIMNPSMLGAITHNYYYKQIEEASKNNSNNKDYLSQIKSTLMTSKTVEEMTPTEIYDHTMNMIIGIDICSNSKFCVLDYQSNVSRFICLNHKDYTKVCDFRYPYEHVGMEWNICPAYW